MKSLKKEELIRLLDAARVNPLHHLAILVAFNHGLRASEVTEMRAEQIKDGYLTVKRKKGSNPTIQPLVNSERAELESLAYSVRPQDRLFNFTPRWFQKIMHKYGERAGIPYHKSHPHILKATCGTLGLLGGMKLNEIQRYLGHRSLASTGAYLVCDDDEASSAFSTAIGEI